MQLCLVGIEYLLDNKEKECHVSFYYFGNMSEYSNYDQGQEAMTVDYCKK